ncbi:MAG: Crp/Fnr family transcriptional regulator [Pseudomonadota bacterium]
MTPHTLKNNLARLPLFCELQPQELERIAAGTSVAQLARDDILFHVGRKLEHCYCIINGQIKLSVTAPSGAEKVVELVGPGRSFAEALLFLDLPSPVTAQAIEHSTIAIIPKSLIFDCIDHSREFTYRMLAGLSLRLHHLISDLESYCLLTSSQRVVGYLLEEAQKTSPTTFHSRIVLPANKNLIASRLHLTPETFSRTLHQLADEGLIKVTRKSIDIPNLDQLRCYGREPN